MPSMTPPLLPLDPLDLATMLPLMDENAKVEIDPGAAERARLMALWMFNQPIR